MNYDCSCRGRPQLVTYVLQRETTAVIFRLKHDLSLQARREVYTSSVLRILICATFQTEEIIL
jgi:hypothetical protein